MLGVKRYFDLSWIASVILAIFPATNIAFGIISRAEKGSILGMILNVLFSPLYYVIDLITILFSKNKISFA